MSKTNKELFKQALNEGLSNRFQNVINNCNENIPCSPKHRVAMMHIINEEPRIFWTSKMKKIVAILVVAILILTSCAIVYREEIRDFIEEIFESFNVISYSEGEPIDDKIVDYYELSYLPENYNLKNEFQSKQLIRLTFETPEGNTIIFEQRTLDYVNCYTDIESGYKKMVDIENQDVYYKITTEFHYYLWNDGLYSFRLTLSPNLPTSELQNIIDGLQIKLPSESPLAEVIFLFISF